MRSQTLVSLRLRLKDLLGPVPRVKKKSLLLRHLSTPKASTKRRFSQRRSHLSPRFTSTPSILSSLCAALCNAHIAARSIPAEEGKRVSVGKRLVQALEELKNDPKFLSRCPSSVCCFRVLRVRGFGVPHPSDRNLGRSARTRWR